MTKLEAASRLTAIGLMSGTSLDGIDVALLSTDGATFVERGPAAGYSYEPAFRRRLADALETAKSIVKREDRPGDLSELERELTMRHAEAVRRFVTDNGLRLSDIDVVGFHGQTVLHRPGQALTVQLGLGQLLADELGVHVVYDMRANDMAHGGEGAPLVPVYHRALAASLDERPVVFVNIGGISNVTYVGENDELVAFDSGPGNTLIDQWVERHAGVPFDQGGAIASEGGVVAALAERYLASDFFTADIRRSLDRNDFPPPGDHEVELADGARTLAHVSAAAIIKAADHFPKPPKRWIICGGGRKNRVIIEDLRRMAGASGAQVSVAEEVGFDGDGMEAEAWAYLAVRSLKGLALTFPGTTRVRSPVTGGVTAYPHTAESP
ncbi:anhydro-N-acetylmuramic acid kinase [Rhizobium sp. EC-SD404]|uniref:anhydro-N-acetylmuramic acid kinase n=1 Tax=Rhizobium sp. EC-SD404 TaxID=2038389 RepID=UPI001255FFDA|nr:anhydro-N-acetylmuramic acid kinase [Rhizobium sp. EC-SD404]VVT22091.1 Anhydro-N-acetylmuramic acid kinase [Rhizobium sp. EC-SD404]